MKFMLTQSKQSSPHRNGFAVLIMFALLVLISMLCVATFRTVAWSRSEVGLIEKNQLARLAATTNTPPASNSIGTK